ncbi:hydantoinase B/oxoprolinase family protein [Mycolicibacterium fluoranthenivorans]|uniref:N-methylhydantoinase B/oxoprolinase/acetone carboxylase alpha subunit n=1 Tax=Mycolicibacterium fluoranthenivorans TaxID=258505 RepID=A0A7X5TVX8_9MYCO|nr:hydantoinase B/oxoprolinase family protein [Mycolicibacterium fluoranthenivorans]MCV7359087.1 hydantoinase B/oxoprolinase family protein [Mycolicibacterium fluoranthenivorans]NIH93729.1 N-methylhydantoinase B/oxoprolinase/acetone carboxylase alpha subunit [Mycolicibacterium fluoranthenivorans]
MTTVNERPATTLTNEEQQWVDKFMDETTLFLGPDAGIMRSHSISERSAHEEVALAAGVDRLQVERIRKRIAGALDEGYEMCEAQGAAPGAKWGDLTTAIYTAAGDVSYLSCHGVIAFSAILHHPIRYIMKYWKDEPTVGVHEGDGFIHNDARYGNVHNTDQSMIMPIMRDGTIIAWVAATIHEGENGACEPGGMPSGSETPFDDGLRMSPFKIVEGGELRRDLLTFLQHSVRDPKLQLADLKVKITAVRKIMERIDKVIDEVGVDTFVGALRTTIEDVDAEVRRRISELPDGTYRFDQFMDSTLKENILIKIACKITVKGDSMTVDLRGTGPEIMNRAINSPLCSVKSMMMQAILAFWWPDLPRCTAAMSCIEIISDEGTWADASYDAPMGQSLQASFRGFSAMQALYSRMSFSTPHKYSNVVANWFNQINTFLWGGITQHGDMVGNLCADLNGMPGGAKPFRDGEDAVSPLFCAMADTAEQEVMEEEVPFMQLVAKRLVRDNMGFGKFTGGMGYEMIVAAEGSPEWGFMTVTSGAKFSSIYGMYGGYGCGTYPLAMVKGTNVYEHFRQDNKKFDLSIEKVMNERPFPDGRYSTYHMGLQFDRAKDGELYMISQGAGGGYGDPLERSPESVIRDAELGRISQKVAETIFAVHYDPATFRLDVARTEQARSDARQARLQRGKPFAEFCQEFVKPEPPKELAYYGSWGTWEPGNEDITATVYTIDGPERVKAPLVELPLVVVPDRREVKIAKLQERIDELEARYGETARKLA